MDFWITAKAVMDLLCHLLIFALLLACRVKWQQSRVAASLPVIWVVLILLMWPPFFQAFTVWHASEV